MKQLLVVFMRRCRLRAGADVKPSLLLLSSSVNDLIAKLMAPFIQLRNQMFMLFLFSKIGLSSTVVQNSVKLRYLKKFLREEICL